jgi:hypothetical protein
MSFADSALDAAKGTISNKLGIVSDCVITMYATRPVSGPTLNGDLMESMILEHSYTLPFNPKEMTITAQMQTGSISSAADPEDTNGNPPPMSTLQIDKAKIYLTVPLVFDEMNIADAFTADKFNTGAGNITKNVGTAIAKAAGAEWTVQPVIEGFVAALRDPNTRSVKFTWGEFQFFGTIEQFNAEYTMFSPAGNPIRAKAMLRVLNDSGADEMAWAKNALDLLGYTTGSSSTLGGIVSNVLNMGW